MHFNHVSCANAKVAVRAKSPYNLGEFVKSNVKTAETRNLAAFLADAGGSLPVKR